MGESTTAAVSAVAADPNPTLQPPESTSLPSNPDPSTASIPTFSNASPNPNPSLDSLPPPPSILTPPPPSIQPSFRLAAPQYSAAPYQTPPVGVIMASASAVGIGAPPQVPVVAAQYSLPGQHIRYAPPPVPNGYPAMPQGVMPPPGIGLNWWIFLSLCS